ncbi:hypothetical protein DFS34DRAFT_140514 [Phlyctochytrium arcticum]|nr:hypothetical protein DFS34DRAFT_140514 [Phlyctochytrium arcticum]
MSHPSPNRNRPGANAEEEPESIGDHRPKTALEAQALKIERLMSRVDKPVLLPERNDKVSLKPPPEFVRNVQGSSAGAGSGEFHVYRALRRKEYARQRLLENEGKEEREREEHQRKIAEIKLKEESKTAKNREKRLKRRKKHEKGEDGSLKKAKTASAMDVDKE